MTEEPIFDDPGELVDDLLEGGEGDDIATGQTSEEFDDSPIADESDAPDKSKKLGFNVYDAMLLVSLLLITVAVVLVVIEGQKFGNFPFEKTRIGN